MEDVNIKGIIHGFKPFSTRDLPKKDGTAISPKIDPKNQS